MLQFIHISDTHIGSDPAYTLYQGNPYQALERLVQHLNALPFTPDFVLHSGDIGTVYDTYDPGRIRLAAQLLQHLRYPVHYVIGNHDVEARATIRETLLGQAPSEDRLFYDFILKDFHFMVLDSGAEGAPQPRGYVTEDQLAWLAERCAQSTAQSLVIFVHHLPLQTGIPWLDNTMRMMNHDAFFEVLKPHRERLRGIFFGHIHRPFTGFRDGILCSAASSTFRQFHLYPEAEKPGFDFQTPGGFALVTLTHQQTSISHYLLPTIE